MTPLKSKSKKRIAAGCGMEIQDINHLLKQHSQMAKMMKKSSNPSGISKMLGGLQGMQKQMGQGASDGIRPLFGGDQNKK